MRKFSLLLGAVALPLLAMAQAKTVPYTSTMIDDDWTIVNETEGTNTWVKESNSTSGYGFAGQSSGIQYKFCSSPADDWAISPAIHLESGKEYKLKFWYRTMSNVENLTVYLAKTAAPTDLKAGSVIWDFEGSKNSTGEKMVFVINPTETADYYVGFYLHSPADRWANYLTGFELVENVFAPGTVTNLTVTPGADRAMEATLSWALPTTDNDGAALPADAVFNSVKVYRDGTLVATLPGDALTWKDTADAGLTSGYHKYEVEVTVNNAVSAKAAVDSKYIGPIAAFKLPYNWIGINEEKADIETFFSVVAGENSTSQKKWEIYVNSSQYNPTCFICSGSSTGIANDWLMLPSMKFDKAGVYRIGVKYKTPSTSFENPRLDVKYGKSATIAAMTNSIGQLTEKHTSGYSGDYSYLMFEVAEPGEYTIGINACNETGSPYEYRIFELSVEEWYVAPQQVADLNATVDGNSVKLTWTNPSKTNAGTDLTTISKIEIKRNGEAAATLTTNLTPGAAASWTDAQAPAGANIYTVLAYLNEHAADGDVATIAAPWVGDKLQQLPYSYNFKDAGLNNLYTTLDLDEKDPSWKLTTSGAVLPMAGYDYATVNDLLVTPPFELTKGYYKVKVSVMGANSKYPVGVGYAVESETIAPKNFQTVMANGYSFSSSREAVVKVDETGRGVFVIRANDVIGESYRDLGIEKIEIQRQAILPSVATDVTVTADPDLALKATVAWTNPSTTNVEGETPVITKAIVYRDGAEIATITEGLVAGQKSEYVDAEVPNAGYYTYKVEVYGAEGCSTTKATEVKSPWIGAGVNIGEQDAPYTANFNDWNIYNVNNDQGTYSPRTWDMSYDGSYAYITSTSTDADDWIISPRLNFEAGHTYVFTYAPYNSTVTSSSPMAAQFDIYFGTGTEVADMTQKLLTVSDIDESRGQATPRTFKLKAVNPGDADAQADEETPAIPTYNVPAGVGTIGFYANTKLDAGVKDVSLYGEPYVQVGIDDITLGENEEAEFYTLQGIRVANPSEGIYIMRRGGKTTKVLIRK